jgi:hypothetical protein
VKHGIDQLRATFDNGAELTKHAAFWLLEA